MMEHSPLRKGNICKHDPTLCSNISTVLDCRCTLAPSQNSPKQNASFSLPLVTSNYRHPYQLHSQQIPLFSILVTRKQKKENGGTRQKIYDQKYDNKEATKTTLVGESGMIEFTRHFKYFGSYILYSLKEYYNIEHIISQASPAM